LRNQEGFFFISGEFLYEKKFSVLYSAADSAFYCLHKSGLY
jgi:hypothetical protein